MMKLLTNGLNPDTIASRPPKEVHGPFTAEGDVVILEMSFLQSLKLKNIQRKKMSLISAPSIYNCDTDFLCCNDKVLHV